MRADEYNGTASAVGMSARERLNADIRALVQDANIAMSDLAEATGQGMANARKQAQERAAQARERAEGLIKDNPWRTVAVIAGIGLALGWLMKRR